MTERTEENQAVEKIVERLIALREKYPQPVEDAFMLAAVAVTVIGSLQDIGKLEFLRQRLLIHGQRGYIGSLQALMEDSEFGIIVEKYAGKYSDASEKERNVFKQAYFLIMKQAEILIKSPRIGENGSMKEGNGEKPKRRIQK